MRDTPGRRFVSCCSYLHRKNRVDFAVQLGSYKDFALEIPQRQRKVEVQEVYVIGSERLSCSRHLSS